MILDNTPRTILLTDPNATSATLHLYDSIVFNDDTLWATISDSVTNIGHTKLNTRFESALVNHTVTVPDMTITVYATGDAPGETRDRLFRELKLLIGVERLLVVKFENSGYNHQWASTVVLTSITNPLSVSGNWLTLTLTFSRVGYWFDFTLAPQVFVPGDLASLRTFVWQSGMTYTIPIVYSTSSIDRVTYAQSITANTTVAFNIPYYEAATYILRGNGSWELNVSALGRQDPSVYPPIDEFQGYSMTGYSPGEIDISNTIHASFATSSLNLVSGSTVLQNKTKFSATGSSEVFMDSRPGTATFGLDSFTATSVAGSPLDSGSHTLTSGAMFDFIGTQPIPPGVSDMQIINKNETTQNFMPVTYRAIQSPSYPYEILILNSAGTGTWTKPYETTFDIFSTGQGEWTSFNGLVGTGLVPNSMAMKFEDRVGWLWYPAKTFTVYIDLDDPTFYNVWLCSLPSQALHLIGSTPSAGAVFGIIDNLRCTTEILINESDPTIIRSMEFFPFTAKQIVTDGVPDFEFAQMFGSARSANFSISIDLHTVWYNDLPGSPNLATDLHYQIRNLGTGSYYSSSKFRNDDTNTWRDTYNVPSSLLYNSLSWRSRLLFGSTNYVVDPAYDADTQTVVGLMAISNSPSVASLWVYDTILGSHGDITFDLSGLAKPNQSTIYPIANESSNSFEIVLAEKQYARYSEVKQIHVSSISNLVESPIRIVVMQTAGSAALPGSYLKFVFGRGYDQATNTILDVVAGETLLFGFSTDPHDFLLTIDTRLQQFEYSLGTWTGTTDDYEVHDKVDVTHLIDFTAEYNTPSLPDGDLYCALENDSDAQFKIWIDVFEYSPVI